MSRCASGLKKEDRWMKTELCINFISVNGPEIELCLRTVAQCLCCRHALRISWCNTVLLDQIGTFHE